MYSPAGIAGEFVPVNVAGLDDTLFSDALFAHLPGAYTAATGKREGIIYDLLVRSTSPALSLQLLGESDSRTQPEVRSENFYAAMKSLPTVDQAVKLLIEEAMRRKGGNQSESAKALGMDRTTLNRRLDKYKREEV